MAAGSRLIPDTEAERLAAVRRYDVLDTPPDGAFDRITRLAARQFRCPIAIVSIVDHDRIWFQSRHGVDVEQVGRDPGLCASAILGDDTWIVEDAATDPRTMANPLVAGELGLRFYAGAPLRTSDGHNLGTLCIIDREPRELSEQEEELLEDLAAVVVDELELRLAARRVVAHEATLREQAERTARTLQRSLLPPALPAVEGAELAALYRPADAAVVGGDFYDVLAVEGGAVLVVGDVSGKGPEAATVSGLARHTLRAAMLSSDSPVEALRMLNRAMLLDRGDRELEHFCTAVVVDLRRADGGLSLRIAAGGHPLPLALRADGSHEELGAPGPPAGWHDAPAFREASAKLAAGETLVIYTDGLTEARTAEGLLGVEGLARSVAAAHPGSPAAVVEALRQTISAEAVEVRDDAAALVLRAT